MNYRHVVRDVWSSLCRMSWKGWGCTIFSIKHNPNIRQAFNMHYWLFVQIKGCRLPPNGFSQIFQQINTFTAVCFSLHHSFFKKMLFIYFFNFEQICYACAFAWKWSESSGSQLKAATLFGHYVIKWKVLQLDMLWIKADKDIGGWIYHLSGTILFL